LVPNWAQVANGAAIAGIPTTAANRNAGQNSALDRFLIILLPFAAFYSSVVCAIAVRLPSRVPRHVIRSRETLLAMLLGREPGAASDCHRDRYDGQQW
jgi:hypothetical protein